jgi:hypothetical protein
MRHRTISHETLAAACRVCAAAIDNVDVAAADEAQCVAELNATDMDTAAAAKNQLALGAQALFESATRTHEGAVHALNALRERTANANAPDDEGSIRTQGTTTTPRSMSSISTTPTVAMATVTPGLILPGNDFRPATSVLHYETTAAIRDIDAIAASKDVLRNAIDLTAPTIRERATIISALKTLLDDGIITPLQVYHARIANNAQDRRITKATVEPQLDQAAARIAAVVEAERPANRPTLKGLIHDDVDKTTEELRCRIQSLETKLGETKNALKRTKAKSGETTMLQRKKAKNEVGDARKSNKTPGAAVALSTLTPKNKTWKRTATKKPTNPATKNSPVTPDINDNSSTTASKKSRKKATGCKSGGKRRGKSTAARN